MNSRSQYWWDLAEYDLETAKAMLETKRYVYVGFMCHQAAEKALKALYHGIYQSEPPRTHNLSALAQRVGISQHEGYAYAELLDELDPLNIEARYPTDIERLLARLDIATCRELIAGTGAFLQWIRQKL